MKLSEFKAYCLENKIPIITDEALNFIQELIKEKDVKNLLEIGTAYGYSAICFSSERTQVDTIEYDEVRYNEAKKWVNHFNANVNLILADAKIYEGLNKQYDLIFIDGAKASYQVFFDKYQKYLKPGGMIVCDNINFHNLTMDKTRSRSTKNMIKKLGLFKTFLETTEDFLTEWYDIGDGVTVTTRVK
ncbi:class I SAM-dependent methyltransferase [Acholeplasma equirhinis]|uniref:O-methyltransferase n=1 Tax=Acholeplasma equirhinis TaxID=555393 RepID=UPI00197AF9A5|nr:class I SAM-dependent methyltransferase [Acholeplasma equirhinis]MBN3490591.1 class I SAM-dependent methyltransferase [Acholeplasma equirhinis]